MNREMFLEEMRQKAKFYSRELWGIDFDGIVRINNRLRSTLAWHWGETIELNKDLIISKNLFADETLVHELCHWYCYKNGLEQRDGDFDFEREIFLSGSRSTDTGDVSKDGTTTLEHEESWYYCKDCSNEKKHFKINKSERINHYGKHKEKAKPKCPHCNRSLEYYCEVELKSATVPFYPRQRLIELHEKYINKCEFVVGVSR